MIKKVFFTPINSMIIAYFTVISIGNTMINYNPWTDIQLFLFSNIIAFIFFGLISYKSWNILFILTRKEWRSILKLGFSMCLMYIPLFVSQKHQVSAPEYCLQYAICLGIIAEFVDKKLLYAIYLITLLLINFLYIQSTSPNFYSIFALLGPVGGYFVLYTTKQIQIRSNFQISGNQIMLIRFFLPALISICIFPFITNGAIFMPLEITKVLIIATFLNILPIFLSQSMILRTSPYHVAQLMVFLPFFVSIFSLIIGIKLPHSILLISFIITIPNLTKILKHNK